MLISEVLWVLGIKKKFFSILYNPVLFLKIFKVVVSLLDLEFLKGKYYMVLIFEYLALSQVPGSINVE